MSSINNKFIKKVPTDWNLHGCSDGIMHFGDTNKGRTSDIKHVQQLDGMCFYKTRNSIYYHKGWVWPAIRCNCIKR